MRGGSWMGRLCLRPFSCGGKGPLRRCSAFLLLAALSIRTFILLGPSRGNVSPRQDLGADSYDPAYTFCLEETLNNLPIGKGRQRGGDKNGQSSNQLVWAHHWDAANDQWNKHIKYEAIEELRRRPCSVWEVGANVKAEDSRTYMSTYPACEYHAYEPMPDFYDKLTENWRSTPTMHLHRYGLGKEDGELNVPPSSLKGLSTYIGDADGERGGEGDLLASIRSFDFAVKDAGSKPTLLHINCEGCEWSLVPGAVESGFIDGIPVIQIAFHNYGKVGLGRRAIEYCKIRGLLNRTHDLIEGAVPFAWERWVLKRNARI